MFDTTASSDKITAASTRGRHPRVSRRRLLAVTSAGLMAFAAAAVAAAPTSAHSSHAVDREGVTGAGTIVVTARNLPLPAGDSSGIAFDVNNHGVAVGSAQNVSGQAHAVVWRRGVHILPMPLSATSAHANAVNELGVIVGRIGARAALWVNGRYVQLGTLPGGTISEAVDINEHGVVAGYSSDGTGSVRPVVWVHGRIHALPIPSFAAGGRATSVNERGQVGGVANKALIWTRDALRILPPLTGDDFSEVTDLNDHGFSVGYSLAAGQLWMPVYWRADVAYPFETLADPVAGMATAVNAYGNAVGWVQTSSSTYATFWEHRHLTVLAGADNPAQALGVNDRGRAVGLVASQPVLWKITHPDS